MRLQDAPQVGDDAGIRALLGRVGKLEDQLQRVQAASSGNQATVDYVLGQVVSAEAAPSGVTALEFPDATTDVPATWLPFDPTADASVTITTSSTGLVAVQAGGYLGLYSVGYRTAAGYIGVEILKGGVQVRPPLNGDGNFATNWSVNGYITQANTGHRHQWLLDANTTYVLRCRRGFGVGAGPSGAFARIDFQGTALVVSKIGM